MRNATCAGTQTSMDWPYCSFLFCDNGGIASSAFLLARKCNWLARNCIMKMRNAKCASTQTSMDWPYCSFLYCDWTMTSIFLTDPHRTSRIRNRRKNVRRRQAFGLHMNIINWRNWGWKINTGKPFVMVMGRAMLLLDMRILILL